MNKAKIISVTGGVGAGKSTVLSFLKNEYNAHIIVADEVAHDLYEPGKGAVKALTALLGNQILADDGSVDRKILAKMIFDNEALCSMVNQIVHPLVIDAVNREIASYENECELIVVEAALLTPGALDVWGKDGIWYVFVPEEIRIKRLMESRGYSEEKCRSVMASQPTDTQYRDFSTQVIDNSLSAAEVQEQIRALLS